MTKDVYDTSFRTEHIICEAQYKMKIWTLC
jgi:hypothetical protein